MSDPLPRASARPELPHPLRDAWTRAGGAVRVMAGVIGVLWALEVVDTVLRHRLDRFGIAPRTLTGLRGVVFAPLLHGGFLHLLSNTVPLFVLGVAGIVSARKEFASATLFVVLVGGIGTWLTGASRSVHIGASGVVFGWAAYLMLRGVFTRRPGQILLGIAVFVLYGTMLIGVLPTRPGVSWQSHLFGAVGGGLSARLQRRDTGAPRAVAAPAVRAT